MSRHAPHSCSDFTGGRGNLPNLTGSNFFELGGHSLLAVRAAAAIEKQTGRRMPPRSLFFQTLRQIAAALPPAEIRRLGNQ
jgi:hypothetical protein